ncbi:MAG: hypothetical protein KAU26_00730 [Methylococcales bacterium]|nr:hypothetical protein [Methylococcales bacterium]
MKNHPCLVGHLPNNPIVPGVVILDYLQSYFQQCYPHQCIKTVVTVKFTHSLRPEELFTFDLTALEAHKFKFTGLSNHKKIIQGFFIAATFL